MDTHRTTIYIKPEEKVKIIRKAQKLKMPMSRLLIMGALEYQENVTLTLRDAEGKLILGAVEYKGGDEVKTSE